jgi:hypothetical protein
MAVINITETELQAASFKRFKYKYMKISEQYFRKYQ